MSRFCRTSRSLGCVKQCSIYVRSGLRCAWCQTFMPLRSMVTVDHLDGDHRNNASENLVAACWSCNGQRRWDWLPGLAFEDIGTWDFFFFDVYLARRGVSIEEAIQRIEWQRWMPLPRSTGELLARRWHPERMAYEDARRSAKIARLRERYDHVRIERRAIQAAYVPQEVSFP